MKRKHNHESRWARGRQGRPHAARGRSRGQIPQDESNRVYEEPYLLRLSRGYPRASSGNTSPQ